MIDIDKLLMDAKRKEEQVVLNLEIAILEAFIIALESIKKDREKKGKDEVY